MSAVGSSSVHALRRSLRGLHFCNRLDAALRASISKNHHGIASHMSILYMYARICMTCVTVCIDLFSAKRQRYLYLLFVKRNSASIRF